MKTGEGQAGDCHWMAVWLVDGWMDVKTDRETLVRQ